MNLVPYIQEKDGKPYISKHRFTCEAQAVVFNNLLNQMADRPQDYVTERGRVTTNSVEGFHGIALMYRDKRTDLGHSHYVCKTNMSICHKVIANQLLLLLSHIKYHKPKRILDPYGKCFVSCGWECKSLLILSQTSCKSRRNGKRSVTNELAQITTINGEMHGYNNSCY